MESEAVGVGLGFLFFVVFMLLWAGAMVYWIVSLVEVARIPDHQFRAGGTDKLVWVLVVALAGIIGALIWRFVERDKVLAAAGSVPPPPFGWYPEPGTGVMRWWDGSRWTDFRHQPPPQDLV